LKYIVIAFIYAYVVFMAWSAFQWLGVAYVLIVPIPFLFFSYLVRRRQKVGNVNAHQPLSLWSSPIPYFSIIFFALIFFHFVT
jgi:heme O synthase-like polyprenyltransferase